MCRFGVRTTGRFQWKDSWSLSSVSTTQLQYDSRTGFGISIRIEHPFVLVAEGREHRLDPSRNPLHLTPVLPLVRAKIISCKAFDGGQLCLTFDRGYRITVYSSADFEPWEICGSRGALIVSIPGGGLATWLPEGL